MLRPALPVDEAARLDRLRELFVLDSEPEAVFDSIALLASQVCGVPIALICLVDGERQWFKANVGLPGLNETPRDIAFCAHAILQERLFEVPDATLDSRFADNPSVTSQPAIRFYAGAPMSLPTGERVGTLCVIDRKARQLDAGQKAILESLAAVAIQSLQMRRDLINKSLSVRTQYEEALAATSAELSDLYDNAPCGYHSLDANGRFVRINNTALRWLGCSRADLSAGLRIMDFLTPEGLATYRDVFPRLMRDGSADNFEFDLVGRDGTTRRLIASATAIRDANRGFLMTRTVTYDITELKRARDDLRRMADEQHAILNTDLVGILKLKDRRIVWNNSGAESLFGYAPGELLDQPTRLLFPDDESHRRLGNNAYPELRVGELYRVQLELVRKDGERRWIDLSATALPSSPLHPLCMLVDITPIKRAEEIRIKAATFEAENRQLLESNRFKGLFLANMSHELRTPLNAVLGYAHLLRAGAVRPDSPKFAHYLSQIDSSGKELLGLIDSVLNFAQVESGKFELHPESLSLSTVIEDVIEILDVPARARRIEIDVLIDPSIDQLVLDPVCFAQIVSHYVSNAIKFSHDGGRVKIRAATEDPLHFRIEVEDVGIGISPQNIPKLFTAFQQLSSGSTKTYPGAGMGLALTQRLAQAQGGTVNVRSELGKGSTFSVTLPRDARTTVATDGTVDSPEVPPGTA